MQELIVLNILFQYPTEIKFQFLFKPTDHDIAGKLQFMARNNELCMEITITIIIITI